MYFKSRKVALRNAENTNGFVAILSLVYKNGSRNHKNPSGFIRFYLNDFRVLQNTVFLMVYCVFEDLKVASRNAGNTNGFVAILGLVFQNACQIHKNPSGIIRLYLNNFGYCKTLYS